MNSIATMDSMQSSMGKICSYNNQQPIATVRAAVLSL